MGALILAWGMLSHSSQSATCTLAILEGGGLRLLTRGGLSHPRHAQLGLQILRFCRPLKFFKVILFYKCIHENRAVETFLHIARFHSPLNGIVMCCSKLGFYQWRSRKSAVYLFPDSLCTDVDFSSYPQIMFQSGWHILSIQFYEVQSYLCLPDSLSFCCSLLIPLPQPVHHCVSILNVLAI